MTEQITVENLILALQQYLLNGGNAKGPVFVEGCDCIGNGIGLHTYDTGLIIRRDQRAETKDISDLHEIITGREYD